MGFNSGFKELKHEETINLLRKLRKIYVRNKRLKIKEKLHYVIGCLQSTHNLDCDILGSDAAYFDSDLPTFLWKELP